MNKGKDMHKIQVKRPYIHFKGNLYYVHDVLIDSETNEKIVSYQALYPPYGMYARKLDMFLEEIDLEREDNITKQKYRFELFDGSLKG